MYLDNVVIEITRRCNMVCEHCLRGDAQRKDITDKILDRFFYNIQGSFIGTLTVTGGEPSLAPSRIKAIVRAARMANVEISAFYMVTNGKKVTTEFLQALLGLQQYCTSPSECYLNYSNDKYHEDIKPDLGKLEVFSFFSGGKDSKDYPLDWNRLITEGRAESSSGRELDLIPYTIEDDRISEGLFYLNALGKVLPSCDLSYESQASDNIILGDVFDESFDLIKYAQGFNEKLTKMEADKNKDTSEVVMSFDHNGRTEDIISKRGYKEPYRVTVNEMKDAA